MSLIRQFSDIITSYIPGKFLRRKLDDTGFEWSSAATEILISDSPPVSASHGDLWIDKDEISVPQTSAIVDLSLVTEDYNLEINQIGKIEVVNNQYIPLHIKPVNNGMYTIDIIMSSSSSAVSHLILGSAASAITNLSVEGLILNSTSPTNIISGYNPYILPWQRNMYLPYVYTTDIPIGEISASSEYNTTFIVENVFDCKNSKWHPSSIVNSWIQYKFYSKVIVSEYTISGAERPYENQSPKDWYFEGSNDGINYDVLDTVTNQTNWTANETRSFVCDITNLYQYYRLKFLSNNGNTYLGISSVRFKCNTTLEIGFGKIVNASLLLKILGNSSLINLQSSSIDNNLNNKTITATSTYDVDSLTTLGFIDFGMNANATIIIKRIL